MLIPEAFVRHSHLDTSFSSWGLVLSSRLFCNYILPQDICIVAHSFLTQIHTYIFFFLLQVLADMCTRYHTGTMASQHQPYQTSQSGRFLWKGETEGTEMKWREFWQSEKDQRHDNISTHCSSSSSTAFSFLFSAYHSSALFQNSLFVYGVYVCLYIARKWDQRVRRHPGHCLVLMWSC